MTRGNGDDIIIGRADSPETPTMEKVMVEESKFNLATATKEECLAKANRMLNLGIKAETAAKDMEEGPDRDTKMRQVEFALKNAVKVEEAAFDGRE